jgi:hypothetical protein
MAWTAPSSRRRSRKAIDWNVLDQTRPSVLGHILSTNKLQSEGPSAALGTVQGQWGPIHAHPKTQAICHNSRFDLHPGPRTQQAQPLVHHYTHTVRLSLVTGSEPRYISLARHPNTQLSVSNQSRSKTISYNLSCNYDNHRHKLELFSLKPSWSWSSASLLLTLDFHTRLSRHLDIPLFEPTLIPSKQHEPPTSCQANHATLPYLLSLSRTAFILRRYRNAAFTIRLFSSSSGQRSRVN